MTTLAVNTDQGPVAMVIWHLARLGADPIAHYEQYLNPLHEPTRRSLQRVDRQARLKLVMRDNTNGETVGFWEFPNSFAMGEFSERLASAFIDIQAGPFDDRVALVQRDYRLEDLIALPVAISFAFCALYARMFVTILVVRS